jgi:peptidyl-dipeptidase Dcp
MKTKIILMLVLQALSVAMPVQAQNKKSSDRDSSEVVRKLDAKKADLSRQIAEEDRKRDQQIEGVSWENMKEINMRISDLQQQWGEMLPDATNDAVVWVDSKEQLAGLSEADIAQCAKDAES